MFEPAAEFVRDRERQWIERLALAAFRSAAHSEIGAAGKAEPQLAGREAVRQACERCGVCAAAVCGLAVPHRVDGSRFARRDAIGIGSTAAIRPAQQ